jgi:hypothetical protein
LTNCTIVPLNPVAMRDVLKEELDYIKIEDFIDYGFCKDGKEKIWRAFQDLLDKADEILSQIYKNPKIKSYGPFNLFAKGIRQTIETMIHNWIIFNKIINQTRPGEIKLLSQKINYNSSEIIIDRFSDVIYNKILVALAKKDNIHFIFSSIEARRQEEQKTAGRTIIFQTIINIIKRTKMYYNRKVGIRETNVNKIDEKALFLQHDWGIYYYSQFFTHIINDSEIEDYVAKSEPEEENQETLCAEIIEKLQNEIRGLNELFGFDVKFIIESTLVRYIRKVPVFMHRASRSEDYLSKLTPRFVFFTNLHENMLPFQMALSWNNEIVKVVKEHGDGMFDSTLYRNNELRPVNIYFSEFKEIKEYMQMNAELCNFRVRCEYDGVRLNRYYSKGKTKNKLVYVPGFFDPCLPFEIILMPQALYFRIQVAILRVLSRQKEIDDVVYKCLPAGQHDYHYPVAEYIISYFKNVRISYRPLEEELRDAMFCLLDTPSSALWEAINMNVPCQTLIWNKINLREAAVEYYEKFITLFDSDLDISTKLRSILAEKRFHTIDQKERKRMKRSLDDIRAIFVNESSRVNVG